MLLPAVVLDDVLACGIKTVHATGRYDSGLPKGGAMTAVFLLRSILLRSVVPSPTTITWSTEVGDAYMGPSGGSNS